MSAQNPESKINPDIMKRIVQLAPCIARIKEDLELKNEKLVQGALFLAQYDIDFANMRMVKYTLGGIPIVADDWVMKPDPWSDTVHKAYVLSILYANAPCYMENVVNRVKSRPKESFAMIAQILCTVLNIACRELEGQSFEEFMKKMGFRIEEIEAP